MIPQSPAPKGDSSWLFMYGLKPVPFTNRVFPYHLKPDLFSMFTARLCRALIPNKVFPQPVEALDENRWMWKLMVYLLGAVLPAGLLDGVARAQGGPLVLERDGRTISLEPYAANILRVTMSTDRGAATAAPGLWVCGQTLGGGVDARARRGRLRCVPIGPDGGASGAGRSAE